MFVNTTVLKLDEGIKMGNSITLNNNYSSSKVTVSGNKINLTITNQLSKKNIIIPQNNKIKGIHNSPEVSDNVLSSRSVHLKFPKDYAAALVVTKIGVSSVSTDSLSFIVGVMGEVVPADADAAIGALAGLSAASIVGAVVVGAVIAALAADYAALYYYASSGHYPTMYLDIGVSIGTQWWNSYDIGTYGEEGAFTGNYNSGNGMYIPLVSTSTNLNAFMPHAGVWNPYAEPPWHLYKN